MGQQEWKSAITDIGPNKINIRGYPVQELMENLSFAEAVYLVLTGEIPNKQSGKLLNAILVSSIDHGVTPPSVMATVTAASTGAPMNGAVAAGILSINQFHGGAIENCMSLLEEGLAIQKEAGNSKSAAVELVRKYRRQKQRMAGFGHRLHSADPRTGVLLNMARSADLKGEAIDMAEAIQKALKSEAGKHLPLNVDGAIASVLLELGIPKSLANMFFVMSRVPGLIAHAAEEKARQRPMRKIIPGTCKYDGPEKRSMQK